MKFSVFQISRKGGRSRNEDRMGYCYTRDAALFLLADGMGGHAAGDVVLALSYSGSTEVMRLVPILKKIGVDVAYLGPGSLVPQSGPENIRRFTSYQEAMAWSPDVVYLLRVQMERQEAQFFPSLREYHRLYGITDARLAEIRQRGLYLMHPGPVNRGVELCDAVMDYERSLINDQVENGIAVRMAVLYWLKPDAESDS